MAIVKTHLFNISFSHQELIKVLIKLEELKQEIFPQDAKSIASNVKGVSVYEESNPYNELLEQMYHICDQLHIEKPICNLSKEEVDIEEVRKQLDDVQSQIEHVASIRQKIEAECLENEEAIALFEGINDTYLNIDDIQSCKYLSYRIGKLPIQQMEKIKYYDEYPFIFKKIRKETNYVWVVYAAMKKNISEIDNIFYALSFEEMHMPDFVHGTMQEAYEELKIEVAAMRKYMQEVDAHLQRIKSENEKQLQDLFVKINSLKRLFDNAKYVVDFSKKAAVFAFSSVSQEELTKRLQDIESVQVLELPTDMYENRGIQSPIIQHNHPLVKPFESFVKVKSPHGFDATTIFGTILLLVSGIVLGDIGVGLLLIVVGLLLDRKNENNIGRIIHRVGAAIMIGGLVYGTIGYQYALYPGLITLPGSWITHILLWFIIIIFAIMSIKGIQKITKNQK